MGTRRGRVLERVHMCAHVLPVRVRLGFVKSRKTTVKREKNGGRGDPHTLRTERQRARRIGKGFYNNCQGLCRCVLNT